MSHPNSPKRRPKTPRQRLPRKRAGDVRLVGQLAHHALDDADVSVERAGEGARGDDAREGAGEAEGEHGEGEAEEADEDDGLAAERVGGARPVQDGEALEGEEDGLLWVDGRAEEGEGGDGGEGETRWKSGS